MYDIRFLLLRRPIAHHATYWTHQSKIQNRVLHKRMAWSGGCVMFCMCRTNVMIKWFSICCSSNQRVFDADEFDYSNFASAKVISIGQRRQQQNRYTRTPIREWEKISLRQTSDLCVHRIKHKYIRHQIDSSTCAGIENLYFIYGRTV